MTERSTLLQLTGGQLRSVDYNHDPPDADCSKCFLGCDYCQGGIVPWEWSIDWYAVAHGEMK